MLSRGYKRKKSFNLSNFSKRKKIIISILIVIALFFVIYTIYKVNSYKPDSGKKEAVKIETGDRPLKKTTTIFINADGGLNLRQDRNTKSAKLVLIPNGTKLEATEELDGWYKVSYDGKEGWISKEYTTIQAPPADPATGWSLYTNTNQGYKIKYPPGWKYQDYGGNEATKSLAMTAFSIQELPTTLPQGSEFIAPVIIQVSGRSIDEVTKEYTSIGGVVGEGMTVAGIPATKYTYTSVMSNTQTTGIVFSANGKTFILSEGGGYAEDLLKMANTFTLGA